MIFFIPGWYGEGAWQEQEQYWYSRRQHTEFDDTVKHIQLFHRNKICAFRILLLSFAPNFRHFLHRQAVYHAPYWSCFDAIQGIERKKTVPLSYHNLQWPKGTEFLYSMFSVLAMRGGEKYAKVDFGEDGNMIEVELYQGGRTVRKNIYDDRGFLSSTIVCRGGVPYSQDYLGEDGQWRIRCFLEDGHIRINPHYPGFSLETPQGSITVPYQKERYEGIGALVTEVFAAYVSHTGRKDIFCAAVHPLHRDAVRQVLGSRNLVLSMFEERNSMSLTPQDRELLSSAGQLLCDSEQGKAVLEKSGEGALPPCTVITPFDTRADFGISQQMAMQKILVPVDGLEPEVFRQLIGELGRYLLKNTRAELYLFSRKADYGLGNQIRSAARKCMEAQGLVWENQEEDVQYDLLDRQVQPEMKGLSQRVFSEQCVDELSVTKCLRMQRLIVDFRSVRDVYLRVVAVSMGIPQILSRQSEFVVSGKNGMVLQGVDSLQDSLSFYLDELANWNSAMVAAYEMGKRFDTASQVEKWKGVIDSFEQNPCIDSGAGEQYCQPAGEPAAEHNLY